MESQIKKRTAILLMGLVMMMYGCDDDTEVEMKSENEIMLTSSQAVTTTTHFEETVTTAKSSFADITTVISETTVLETTLPETSETEPTTTTVYTEQQTEPSVLETEPPQTEPPVSETEPPQTEPSAPETEPLQTESPDPETEPSYTEPVEPPVEEIPSTVSEYQREVLRIVNEARVAEGLPAFEGSELLNTAANVRAQEIYASFSHTRPDGSSCFSIAGQMGISAMTMGENIAAGSATPEGVVQQLLNSPPHRANIMSSDFTAMGVGYFETGDSYKYYWVQFFIG